MTLDGYRGPIRQLAIADLGHEEPTLLLTNQLRRSAPKLISRYAQRMLIENNIEDGVNFFHMDALSSAVAMKVNCDLQLTLMASSLYRFLAADRQRIRDGQVQPDLPRPGRRRSPGHAHRTGGVVRFQKRAHNPLLLAAGFAERSPSVPWWGGRRLRLRFG